ncbi:MAG: hypothetical protein HFI90_00740 [Clostridia bacterium]|nr:hypothetical protein [Clostridia bacterium]
MRCYCDCSRYRCGSYDVSAPAVACGSIGCRINLDWIQTALQVIAGNLPVWQEVQIT